MKPRGKDVLAAQARLRASYLARADRSLAEAEPVLNPYGASPLTALLPFRAREAGHVSVRSGGLLYEVPVQEGPCLLPLIGLVPDTDNEVRIALGAATRSLLLRPETPQEAPKLEVRGTLPADRWLFLLGVGAGASAAWDDEGQLRWVYEEALSHALLDLGDGTFLVGAPDNPAPPYGPTALWRMDLLGYVHRVYHLPTGLTGGVAVLGDGSIVCVSQGNDEGCIRDRLLWLDPDTGEVLRDLRLADAIPKAFGEARQSGSDWLGAQSLSYDSSQDLLFLSCHQQSAVLAIRGESGEVVTVYAHKTPWPQGPWQAIACDLGIEPWLALPFGAYGDGQGGFRVLCEDSRRRGLTLYDVSANGEPHIRLELPEWQSHVMNDLSPAGEYFLCHAGGRQAPSHRVALFQQGSREAPPTWSETMLIDETDRRGDRLTHCRFDVASYGARLWRPMVAADAPAIGPLGRWLAPLEIDIDLPVDAEEAEDGSFEARTWVKDGRLYLQATFYQGEAVALILRRGEERHTYYVQANRRPYGAFWLRGDTDRPERPVIWAIGVEALAGEWQGALWVDNTLYHLREPIQLS